jgi:hypothetical protein
MGTLIYMAPEQGRDGRSDARSDTYSLGIAIYEALTGSVPYDADTPLAILMKHINDPLPLPRKLNPQIPERLEAFVLKALAKDPEDRFQSALEMAEALRASARESGIDIPERIELPRTSDMPTASQVAVFSGKARQEIPDDGFASEDTDITFGRSRRSSAALLDQARSLLDTARSDGSPGPVKVNQSVLAWVGTLTLGNMLMLWLSGIFGWDLFGRIWPMEIVLVGLLLAALMAALPNYWLIIPAGILIGNGYLLSFFALTGNWSYWTYLWPLEPILVGTALILPFFLHRDRVRGLWRARRLGLFLVILSIVIFFISLIVGTIRSI